MEKELAQSDLPSKRKIPNTSWKYHKRGKWFVCAQCLNIFPGHLFVRLFSFFSQAAKVDVMQSI